MHQHRRTRLLLAVPAAALLAASLVGCGELFENAAEDRIEDALESEGYEGDVDLDKGEINIDSTDGGVAVGKLPKGFPESEVPVVDGEILGGSSTKNPDTWNVTIKVGDAGGDKAAAYDEAEALLLDAGLDTVTEKVDNGTGINGTYSTDTYLVNLTVTDSNGLDVTYVISPK